MSLLALRRAPGDAGSQARRFVGEVLEPSSLRTERDGRIPDEVARQMRELGYFGLTIPSEYGGSQLGFVDYLEVVRELARSNLAFQELIEENNGIGSASLLIAGSDEQKRTWLPRLASGEVLAAFALTEPDAGSDAAAIRTTARPVADGFELTGRKRFITHGSEAGLITVVARTPAADGGGFTLFLVTPGTPGFSVAGVQPMMGYRATRHAELTFDEVFVPHRDVVGPVGGGFEVAMQTLDRGRLTVAADCLGTGDALLDAGLAYARERSTFGRPLASRGQIRELLARSAAELFLLESRLFDFAARVEAGESLRDESSRVKLFASEAVGRIADRVMQIHGGVGYTVEAQIERRYRDIRVMRIAEGASEVLRSVIARSAIRRADEHKETAL